MTTRITKAEAAELLISAGFEISESRPVRGVVSRIYGTKGGMRWRFYVRDGTINADTVANAIALAQKWSAR